MQMLYDERYHAKFLNFLSLAHFDEYNVFACINFISFEFAENNGIKFLVTSMLMTDVGDEMCR